ncbi:MAG TPA: S24/S26 family peptidase [Pseudonocardiaceae bacterium]
MSADGTPATPRRGLRRVLVRGPSMSPALSDGDVVLVRFGRVARPGDVVLVRWDARPAQLSVKRAVRPDGDGWHVRGDNPFGSTDSRTLGPARVVGVALARLWPRPARLRPAGSPAAGDPPGR